MKAKFSFNGNASKEIFVHFKNSRKLACEIPDMGAEVPTGHHHLNVEVTLNGQQYSSGGPSFLYNSVDPNLTEEDLKKMDEAEEKAKKAPAKKR